MSAFVELLRSEPDELPSETQRRARDSFANLRASSSLAEWSPADTQPPGSALVIGAAAWSGYDLRLLDYLNERLSVEPSEIRVAVFDVDLHPLEELRRRIPFKEGPLGSPIVGHWVGGRLIEGAWGHAGRQLIYRVLGVDAAEAERFVVQRQSPSAV